MLESMDLESMDASDTDMLQQKVSVEGGTGMTIQFWLICQWKFRLHARS